MSTNETQLRERLQAESTQLGHHIQTRADIDSDQAAHAARRDELLGERAKKAHDEVEHAHQVDFDTVIGGWKDRVAEHNQLEKEHDAADQRREALLDERRAKAHKEVEHAKDVAAAHRQQQQQQQQQHKVDKVDKVDK